MKKYIVTEITSSDNFQTGVPIELEGVKAFGTPEEARKYMQTEYKKVCKSAKKDGSLQDSEIDDDFCEVVRVTDDETLTYHVDITEVNIPITEFDLCYEKLAEHTHDADEEIVRENAYAMVNDDQAWEGFDDSLCYYMNEVNIHQNKKNKK